MYVHIIHTGLPSWGAVLVREGSEGVMEESPFTSQLEYFSVWSTMNSRCMSIAFFLFSSSRTCCLWCTI